MEGYGARRSPRCPSRNASMTASAGSKSNASGGNTSASLPLAAIRRPRDTPLWKLKASLKCRSCRKGRCAPPVHMIRLTEQREITPYVWVHPENEDR
jgi:hypothetical protein